MTSSKTEQGGWFCYARWSKGIHYYKYAIEGGWVFRDTAAYYDSMVLQKFPITKLEFDHLSLEELRSKYPLQTAGEVK